MKKKHSDLSWLPYFVFVLLIIFILFIKVINIIALCENQKVFWIKGTQYSCSIFK